MNKLLIGFLALATSATALHAADKPATTTANGASPSILIVNVGEVYNNYYRAQEAQEKLQSVIDAAQVELNKMIEEGTAVAKSLEDIQTKLNNPALTEEAKQKYLDQGKLKAEDLQKREQAINQFRQDKQTQFGERRQAMLNLYLGEIGDAAAKLAQQKGAQYVMNATAMVYSDSSADLTEELITTLNASKPADSKASKAKDEKSAAKK